MKKEATFVTIAFIFAIMLCGTASATQTYDIGQKVTNDAGTTLGTTNTTSPDNVLVITTAGSAKFKNSTTEDSLQGIVDTTSTVTLGNGNLITLNNPNGALEFTFVKKSGDNIWAKKYTAISAGTSYTISASNSVYIGADMTEAQWNTAKQQLGSNAFTLATIANAWAKGAPKDLLKIAGSSGGVSEGLISSYAMSNAFVKNYPLAQDDQSYHVIVTPGGGDDNVPMYLMDDTPLKWVNNGKGTPSYYTFYAMNSGNPNENAYIWWDRGATTGNLVLWKPNSQNKIDFGAVITGGLSEIKYNNWLLGLLTTNPSRLVIVENAVQINKENFDYLWAKGIDKTYINSLTPISNPTIGNVVLGSNYNNMHNIGQQAAQLAQTTFGQALNANDLVITSAGYVIIDGKSTSGALDGIMSAISGMQLENLMSLKRAPWNTLWFTFVKKGSNGALNSVFIKYDATTGLVIIPVNGMNVFDISASDLAGNKGTQGYANAEAVYNAYLSNTERPSYSEPHYYIVSLANQWAIGMPYDFQTAAIGGGCPGSGLSQGYVISNYVQANIPIGPGQKLITISVPAHCKEQVLMNLLGLNPATGTYYTPGLQNSALEPNAAGIFILWNEATNTGTATLLTMDRNIISNLQNEDLGDVGGYYYRTMYWALWYMEHAFPGGDRVSDVNSAFKAKEIAITKSDFNALVAAGGDSVKYIQEFVDVTAPTVTVTPNQNTPSTGPISINLSMDEKGTIYYSLNGSSWAVYANPIDIAKNGVYTLSYYAVDLASNTGSIITKIFTIAAPITPTNHETGSSSGTETGTSSQATVSSSQATSLAAAQTTPVKDVAPGLPLGDSKTAQTSGASGIPVVPVVGGIILAIILVLAYIGRNNVIAAIRGSERLGK